MKQMPKFYFKKIAVHSVFILILVGTSLFCNAQNNESCQNSEASILKHKVDSVLSLMTIEEKVGQLTLFGSDKKDLETLIKEGKVAGTSGMLPGKKDVRGYLKNMQQLAMQSRLKIPLLFMGDVIHGYRTCFPVTLAQSCSWNPGLVQMKVGS